jgi:hypothetical protein
MWYVVEMYILIMILGLPLTVCEMCCAAAAAVCCAYGFDGTLVMDPDEAEEQVRRGREGAARMEGCVLQVKHLH